MFSYCLEIVSRRFPVKLEGFDCTSDSFPQFAPKTSGCLRWPNAASLIQWCASLHSSHSPLFWFSTHLTSTFHLPVCPVFLFPSRVWKEEQQKSRRMAISAISQPTGIETNCGQHLSSKSDWSWTRVRSGFFLKPAEAACDRPQLLQASEWQFPPPPKKSKFWFPGKLEVTFYAL